MTIRPAQPSDMKQVLERIRELAVFEKEPEAVVITEADLIRDGFSDPPLFQCLVAEEQDIVLGIALFLLSVFHLERENDSFGRFDCQSLRTRARHWNGVIP